LKQWSSALVQWALPAPTRWRAAHDLASSAAAGVMVVGALVLLGYWSHDAFAIGSDALPMALPTAALFVFLGAGLLAGTKSPVLTGRAVASLAVGLGVGFAPQGLRLVTPLLPTGALLALLDAGPFLGDAAAQALTARQFSPDEIPKVAGAVLDLRRDERGRRGRPAARPRRRLRPGPFALGRDTQGPRGLPCGDR